MKEFKNNKTVAKTKNVPFSINNIPLKISTSHRLPLIFFKPAENSVHMYIMKFNSIHYTINK